jgi:hypothetical protein
MTSAAPALAIVTTKPNTSMPVGFGRAKARRIQPPMMAPAIPGDVAGGFARPDDETLASTPASRR